MASIGGGSSYLYACRTTSGGSRTLHVAKYASGGSQVGSALSDDTFVTFDSASADIEVLDSGETFRCFPPQPPYYMSDMTALTYSGYKFGMYGLNGNDVLDGGSGRDELCGGRGDDALYGAAANDTLDGFDNNDALFGEGGADVYLGGRGVDVLFDPVVDGSYNTLLGEDDIDCLEIHETSGLLNCGGGDDYYYAPLSVSATSCENRRTYTFCTIF